MKKGTSAMTPSRVLDAIEVINWLDGNVSMPLMVEQNDLPTEEFAARLRVMETLGEARRLLMDEAGKLIRED